MAGHVLTTVERPLACHSDVASSVMRNSRGVRRASEQAWTVSRARKPQPTGVVLGGRLLKDPRVGRSRCLMLPIE
jgi:hypothetical protein